MARNVVYFVSFQGHRAIDIYGVTSKLSTVKN